MKKTVSILMLTVAALLFSSYAPPHWQSSSFGPWSTSNCYTGIDFCVKRASYSQYTKQYEWVVKFRSRYYAQCNFSFEIKESYVNNVSRYTNRLQLKNGEEYTTYKWLGEANNVSIFISEVRFGEDYGDYASCDYGR